jgi:hypothetical protein
MFGSFQGSVVECEAVSYWVKGGFGLLACEGGVPALEPGDEDHVPVFGAEVPAVPE